jgi:hypothetical protein
MALRDLSTQAMVAIVDAWIDPARERKHIEVLPKASILLPTLEEAKDALLTTQTAANATTSSELPAVQKEQAEVDDTHDRKARGIYGALTAFAEIVDDPNKAAQYLALRDKLFPRGMAIVNWSYTDEAGEANLVEGRLTASDRALLKQLPYPGGKLYDAHESRVLAARRLGELETKKQTLTLAQQSKDGKIAPADVVKTRNAWIRTVRAFVSVLELENSLSNEARQKILGPLEEAERKASKRGGKETIDEEPKKE